MIISNREAFFIIFLLTICSSFTVFADSRKFLYRGSFTNETYLIDQTLPSEGLMYFGGDRKSQVKFCDNESEYFCFDSFGIAFYVPKNLNESSTSWTVDNLTFSVTGRNISLELLGQKYTDLYIISGPINLFDIPYSYIEMKFLYSQAYGLLGFSYFDDTRVFWSEKAYGFGKLNHIH